jgi:predicted ATPase
MGASTSKQGRTHARTHARTHIMTGERAMVGPADYAAIASAFHTLVLTGVPALGAADASDRAKRLIIAVDAMYQHRTKLVIAAAGALLYTTLQTHTRAHTRTHSYSAFTVPF